MNDTERLIIWASKYGFAYGHGDTFQDILDKIGYQVEESQKNSEILNWIEKKAIGLHHDNKGIPYLEYFNKKGYIVHTEGNNLRENVIKAMEQELEKAHGYYGNVKGLKNEHN